MEHPAELVLQVNQDQPLRKEGKVSGRGWGIPLCLAPCFNLLLTLSLHTAERKGWKVR